MQRTVEAILHPDGTIEVLEPLVADTPRRVLLTILDEAPRHRDVTLAGTTDEATRCLDAAGLLDAADDIPATLTPLAETERIALAAQIPAGTPLSQLIDEDREERF